MDGGRDGEADNVIPHGSPHVPHDCFETRDRTIKILRWSFLLSGSSRTKLPQCLQWLSSSLASVSQAGGWWNLFRGDCGTCYRRSSLWGWRLHPPLCGDGQPALPLLHLHLLRPPRHPWGAHLGGRRVSQNSRWVSGRSCCRSWCWWTGVQWSRVSGMLLRSRESWSLCSK